ncbi:hypothetical protein PLICRDRAFT_179706 [Plicaturopsis crispa FD-325 SS-3]|uniref:Uncharacterized protein n=1 Tax=Plicaturopsis crispa FD-325 SS-3 TaxID=944288 RepID=A0A0C9SXM1_PLICR|nr:hypothetical protein PLICRDRAFT_179706 [Plicaturopsis crispa FD-325 SS-3]
MCSKRFGVTRGSVRAFPAEFQICKQRRASFFSYLSSSSSPPTHITTAAHPWRPCQGCPLVLFNKCHVTHPSRTTLKRNAPAPASPHFHYHHDPTTLAFPSAHPSNAQTRINKCQHTSHPHGPLNKPETIHATSHSRRTRASLRAIEGPGQRDDMGKLAGTDEGQARRMSALAGIRHTQRAARPQRASTTPPACIPDPSAYPRPLTDRTAHPRPQRISPTAHRPHRASPSGERRSRCCPHRVAHNVGTPLARTFPRARQAIADESPTTQFPPFSRHRIRSRSPPVSPIAHAGGSAARRASNAPSTESGWVGWWSPRWSGAGVCAPLARHSPIDRARCVKHRHYGRGRRG